MKTGMIGLGAMGFQMARHMAAKGHEVWGTDIDEDVVRKAEAVGVTRASGAAAVGREAEIVVVMVATDKQVEDVVLGSGLLDSMAEGSIICLASSSAMELCRRLEQACDAKGIGFLDTPVVLGQEAADNGTLTVFCGGRAEVFEKAKPVLQAFGANIMRIGDAGMGQLAKTINNMLLWATIVADYEALAFAKKVGADIPALVEALKGSSGANWALSRWGRSTGKWAEKDMDVALDLAQSVQIPVPMAALVDQLMKGMTREKMQALLD